MRLGVWLETWFERGRIEWARSTQQHRAAILDKWIAPYLSGVRLRDLGEARVRRWRHDVHGDGCSPQQCNQALRVLSAALGAAVGDGHLPSNPCLRVKRLTVPKPRARVMTPDQIERLRVAMPSQRDRVLLGLLAYAGLRPEEALALRWIDVGRLLVIDRAFTHGEEKGTKTNQRRTVEIIKPLAADLEALRAGSGGEGLVAPSGTGGHLHLGNWRNRIWIPACARAGVEATPYDCRHSYASLLIHAGRSPLAVAAALGHASGETTWKHYAHVFEEAQLASSTPVEDAILAARLRIEGQDRLHESCTVEVLKPLDLLPPKPEKRPRAGRKRSTRGRIRTCDLWLRRPALYPLSYARSVA